MRSGAVEVLLLGAACGLIGPFVVQRNLTFFGHALSHTIFPLLVLATVVGINPLLAATAGAALTVVLVHQLQRSGVANEDGGVGSVFVGLFAAGVVLVGWLRLKAPDVNAAVVGNLLGIRETDLLTSAALVFGLGLVIALLYPALVLICFDRLAAQAMALPIAVLDLVVLGAVASVPWSA